jgi:hypothetical protein
VSSLEAIGRGDLSGLLLRRDETTNSVPSLTTSLRTLSQPSVKRTIQYAVSHYDNLLRKLAD